MKNDLILSLAVLIQLMAVTFQLLLPIVGYGNEDSAALIRILLTVLTYVPAAYVLFLRKWYVVVIPIVLYFFILSVHYFLFPESHTFIESSVSFTLTPISILTAIFVCNIKDFDLFREYLLYCSRLYILLAAIYIWAFYFFPKDSDSSTYSMAFGYASLLPCMYLFLQKNIYDVLMSVVLLVMILFAGSRGPLAAIGAFYIVHFFFLPTRQKIWLTFFLSILVLVSVIYLIEYVDLSASRTIMTFMSGDASEHSTRDGLYLGASKLIAERPFFGWGIGADRNLLGAYCHSIFYEITLHYGLLFSMCFFLLFVIICIRNLFLKRLENNGGAEFYLMMIIYGFVPMIVSSSYLLDFKFAILIGYLSRFLFQSRNKRNTSVYKVL